ncbi:MAG TPA: alpha/beta hydrolase [Thermoanaerobaculia bacterium]|nr:alpha/beta hydrolase [Thermoanaerobaculia bacterium]
MRRAVVATVVTVAVLGVSAPILVGTLLSRPVQASVGRPPLELGAGNVVFPSESGANVRGWWAPAVPSRGAVLLLPGVRANRRSMVNRALFLHRAGYSVLLIDLQATGETRGKLITFGWLERFDVIAAVDFIRRTEPQARIGIIGMSLGGAAAALAAPPLQVEAVVLEAVYPSIDQAVRNRLVMRLGRMAEALTPLLLLQLRPRIGVDASAMRPVDHMAAMSCPVFIIAGTADRHTTEHDTRQLYAAANAPKQLWLVPGASHVDIQRAHPAEYEARILKFFGKALQR